LAVALKTSRNRKTNSRRLSTSVAIPPIIRAVDFFCGAGGLTHGLEKEGVKVVAGVDLDAACKYPYEANNASRFIHKDVTKVTAKEIKQLLGTRGLTLLAGCAPCQPFSTYSQSARKQRDNLDWDLLLSFGKLIRKVQPDLVTMENVPEVLGHDVFKDFLAMLRGYEIDFKVVECDRIGVPQTRSRLVLVASKLGKIKLALPKTRKKTTVRNAIARLPKIKAGESDEGDPLHTSSSLSDLNLLRMRSSKQGGTWRDWPTRLVAPCHRKKSGKTYSGVYGRMSWDDPAPTITTQCFGFGNGRFGHPVQHRAISLREAAIIQSFPRRYAFVEDGKPVHMKTLGRLIGNAVPVELGRVIAKTLVKHAQEARKKKPKRS
jgi:DNA (cytosine-5)-methyltransferase 1